MTIDAIKQFQEIETFVPFFIREKSCTIHRVESPTSVAFAPNFGSGIVVVLPTDRTFVMLSTQQINDVYEGCTPP